MTARDDYGIQATETSHRILESIETTEGATLTEIADDVGLSKGAIHKHLATLQSIGYVQRTGDEYEIGLRLVSFGVQARRQSGIYDAAKPQIVKLANLTGEQACLVVPDRGQNWNCIYLDAATSSSPDIQNQEGTVRSLHATAGGKAILSHLDQPDRTQFLETTELSPETENTITGTVEIESELQVVRDQGVAFDRREQSVDVRGVAAPVLDNEGTPLGAIEILGPADRLSGKRLEEDAVGLVVSSARKIENELTIS